MILKPAGELQIGSMNRRCVLLRFSSEEECKRAWLRNQLMIDGNRLWLSRWRPENHLIPNRDSSMALVWLQLPFLPIHLFSFEMLARICAPIGRVVALDSATVRRTRPNVAKVRVELDVTKPICDRVWIKIGGTGFWQSIEAEGVPKYCSVCGRFGHNVESCRIRSQWGELGMEGPRLNAAETMASQRPQSACKNAKESLTNTKEGLAGENCCAEPGVLQRPPTACKNVRGNTSQAPITIAAKEGKECPTVDCRIASEGQNTEGCGLSVSEQERMVQEAILEAAENILDEVAEKVVKEGCSTPRWAVLVENEEQSAAGKAEMEHTMESFGCNLKQGNEVAGNPSPASSAESNKCSSGQGKGLTKNHIRREKRKQSEARMAENKRRAEKESSQVYSGLSEPLMELEVWMDKAREVVNKEEAVVVEKARVEVLQFFKHAQIELGEERVHEKEEELVQKANVIFLEKLGNIQGKLRRVFEEMGIPMKGRREVDVPGKGNDLGAETQKLGEINGSPTHSFESSGTSMNQNCIQSMEGIDHRAFVVEKKVWEEAKLEIAVHMSNLKKEMGLQEFERRREEIVEKTKALYLDKLKELSKGLM